MLSNNLHDFLLSLVNKGEAYSKIERISELKIFHDIKHDKTAVKSNGQSELVQQFHSAVLCVHHAEKAASRRLGKRSLQNWLYEASPTPSTSKGV